MFKQIILPLIAVFLFIGFVGLLNQGKFNKYLNLASPSASPTLKSIKIENLTINVEVADTPEERSTGLSNRQSLKSDSGMVFIFPKDSRPTFWMKDTNIPLDIIWINDNKIVGIHENVPTEIGKKDSELKRYTPTSVVDYVLEVNAGFSDTNKIKVGQSLSGLEQL